MTEAVREDGVDASSVVFMNGEFENLLADLSHVLEMCVVDRALACVELKKIRERLFEKEVLGNPYHSLQVVHP